jgi:hypothetical protein
MTKNTKEELKELGRILHAASQEILAITTAHEATVDDSGATVENTREYDQAIIAIGAKLTTDIAVTQKDDQDD